MQVTKLRVQNFRLLKDTVVDLEANLSLVLGKNNHGKTSLLTILDKFLGGESSRPAFSFDDFNSDFKMILQSCVEDPDFKLQSVPLLGIGLQVFIEYKDGDDLANIGNKVIMDLAPENKFVVLSFEYKMPSESLNILKSDYKEHQKEKSERANSIFDFLKEHHSSYFQIAKKSVLFDIETGAVNDEIFTDLIKEKIQIEKILNFKWISARRNVSNKDSDRALSILSSRMYKKMESSKRNQVELEKFKDELIRADGQLDAVYKELFKDVLGEVRNFGGMKKGESIVQIVSTLQHRDLLEQNTTVIYGLESGEHTLPENYNGLGYMSLISLIFEIKILIYEFQKNKDERPSDINLLFIEEPEVHTHPQMQCVFIKNIKTLLRKGVQREDGLNRNLQTIISTHSAHIVSESEFEDIKYFKRTANGIISKNLKDLKAEYGEENKYYKFLTQYLTLHRSQLFFADKAIFIEGDTERILLPAMLKKVDQQDQWDEFVNKLPDSLPLLSQNISVVEVGAYAQIFEKFIDFIGIRSLILTDIDSIKAVPDLDDKGVPIRDADGTSKMITEACRVSDGDKTSNGSLKFFFDGNDDLEIFKAREPEKKILMRDQDTKKWFVSEKGFLRCTYQITEQMGDVEYYPRSFEDAFVSRNREFMVAHTENGQGEFIGAETFPSLTQKSMKFFKDNKIDAYDFARTGVSGKPSFAMEILLNSTREIKKASKAGQEDSEFVFEYANWEIPKYIEEGL